MKCSKNESFIRNILKCRRSRSRSRKPGQCFTLYIWVLSQYLTVEGNSSHQYKTVEGNSSHQYKTEKVHFMSQPTKLDIQHHNRGTLSEAIYWQENWGLADSNWMEGQNSVRTALPRKHWSISNKRRNNNIKCKNGNRTKASIRLAHWNLGSTFWQRKVDTIQNLVDEKNPDLCYISEANLMGGLNDYESRIRGYTNQKLKRTPYSATVE